MEIIRLPGYIEDEKLNIAKNYLVPRNLDKNGLTNKEVSFSTNSILKIIRNYTREAGVSFDRQLNKICRKKVKDISMKKPSSTKIDNRAIRNILGSEPFKFGQFDEENQKGQVNGLAWTSVGGIIKIALHLLLERGEL